MLCVGMSTAAVPMACVNFQANALTCAFRHHTLEVPGKCADLLACVNFQAMRCTRAFRHHTLEVPGKCADLLACVNFQAMRCTRAFRHHTLEVPGKCANLLACVNFQAMRCTRAFRHHTLEVPGNVLHLGILPPYYVVALVLCGRGRCSNAVWGGRSGPRWIFVGVTRLVVLQHGWWGLAGVPIQCLA
jgi:hypothetical protein